MNINKNLTDRAKGAFLGFAIGDALGWPQERLDLRLGKGSRTQKQPSPDYIKWERRSAGRFKGYREIIYPGEYSDDTQLMLATARSLLKGKHWNQYLIRQELPAWLLYMRGAGRSVMSAANSWQANKAPWNNPKIAKNYFLTGANGVAMRILPHVLLPNLSIEELQRQIMLNGILTHAHPRALMGAKIYAQAARYLLNLSDTLEYGSLIEYLLDNHLEWSAFSKWENNYESWKKSADKYSEGLYEQNWETTKKELIVGLNLCADELRKGSLAITQDFLQKIGAFDRKTNGSGVVAALSSIFIISRYATNPTSGILELAFSYNSDTDTLAAMAGGLFGALLGIDWIPSNWLMVQDKEYIAQTASELCASPFASSKKADIKGWTRADSKKLIDELLTGKTDEVSLGEIGIATVHPSQNCSQLVKKTKPLCWKLQFSFGQSIHITSLIPTNEISVENKPKATRQKEQSPISLWTDLFQAKPSTMRTSDFIYILSGVASILEEDIGNLGSVIFAQRLNEKDYPSLVAQEMIERGYSISEKTLGHIASRVGMLMLEKNANNKAAT